MPPAPCCLLLPEVLQACEGRWAVEEERGSGGMEGARPQPARAAAWPLLVVVLPLARGGEGR